MSSRRLVKDTFFTALQGPYLCAAIAIIHVQVNPDMGVEPDYASDGAFQFGVFSYVIVAVRMVSQARIGRNDKSAGKVCFS